MLLKAAARYGVYATVFLYKAKCAGAFKNDVQCREVADLVLQFIAVMKEAPSVETHICHGYSRMMRQLWHGPEARASSQLTRPQYNSDISVNGQEDFASVTDTISSPLASSPAPRRAGQDSPAWDWESFVDTNSSFTSGALGQVNDTWAFPTIEAHPFGSFWPGISGIWGEGAVQTGSWEQRDPLAAGFHQAGVEHNGMDFLGTM